ncbi:MAG: RNA-binding cell elongation regulator Jag/EloR [Eubacteriales bacterium]|nr:RNA-binding cell elongation regulator Jag/EloR [Eubacteriales bacterium]
MKTQVEKLGKTVDEAIEDALAELRADYDEVIIEVLDEGDSGGLLGFGRRPARVRLSLADTTGIAEDEETESDDYVSESQDDIDIDENDQDEDSFLEEDYDEDFEEESETDNVDKHQGRLPYSEQERAVLEDQAVEFVANVLQNLDIHGRISSFFADDGALHIEVSGDNLGNAIGRQGETLYALQYLTTLVINQDHTRYQRLVLDIDHYRDRRMRQLRQQARRSAERVLKTGRRYVMKPMNAAERRQIHLALSDFQGIVTYSEGQEPKRCVVIDRDEEY